MMVKRNGRLQFHSEDLMKLWEHITSEKYLKALHIEKKQKIAGLRSQKLEWITRIKKERFVVPKKGL